MDSKNIFPIYLSNTVAPHSLQVHSPIIETHLLAWPHPNFYQNNHHSGQSLIITYFMLTTTTYFPFLENLLHQPIS